MPFVDLFAIPEREVYVRSGNKVAEFNFLARAAKPLLQIGMMLSIPSMFCYMRIDELAHFMHMVTVVMLLYCTRNKTRTCI